MKSKEITKNSEPRKGFHAKFRPFVFTEQGIVMLSSVLRSPRAILVNVEIMRTFVRLRQLLSSNANLTVFDAIRELMKPPEKPGRRIGFRFELNLCS